MPLALLRVSTRPACRTAATKVDSCGLFEAAVATGSWAMPAKLPAPSLGTDAHAGPNCALASPPAADGGGAAGEVIPGSVPPQAVVTARATPPAIRARVRE